LSFIVKAFKTASLSQTTQSLIEDDKPIIGDDYTMFTLTSLAVAQCKTYRKYQIRQLINIGLAKSAKNMRQIESNMNKIQSLVDEFKEEIKKIIHEAGRSGLKGECNYEEQELKFFHCKHFPQKER
jgi:hypothetical protein